MTVHLETQRGAPHIALKPRGAEALVLNCMDHALLRAVAEYLRTRGLEGRYDQISVAGGAVGVMAEAESCWAEAFWAQLKLARTIHGIERIIVIDHRDCGTCNAFCGCDCSVDSDRELLVHMTRMEDLADEILTREPGLQIELLLMDRDGSVVSLGY